MANFLKNIENILKRYVKFGEKIAIAVSGGSDSMALVYALHSLKYDIVVLTVDHNLRKNSKFDVNFVKKKMKILRIPVKILYWNGKYRKNLEEEARIVRYALLIDECKKNNIKTLCIAHHQGDQVETFLMNLMRGSGVDGLSAMPIIKNIEGVNIFRPMLDIKKSDIMSFLQTNNIYWVEDESNKDISFRRNNLRKLLENFEDISVLENRLTNTCKHIQEAKAILDSIINDEFKKLVQLKDNIISFNRLDFKVLNKYIQNSIFVRCLMNISKSNQKPRLKPINDIVDAINSEKILNKTLMNCTIVIKKFTVEIKLDNYK